jgi:hypothetical protein
MHLQFKCQSKDNLININFLYWSSFNIFYQLVLVLFKFTSVDFIIITNNLILE